MTMFHEDLAGEEAPFGVVTFAGADAARLPARGSAVVQAQVMRGSKFIAMVDFTHDLP